MNSRALRLLPLILGFTLLAGCGSGTTVPDVSSLSRARSPIASLARSRCGPKPQACAHVRLVAPFSPLFARGMWLQMKNPQCSRDMVPAFASSTADFPESPDTYSGFFHGNVPVFVPAFADPCGDAQPNGRVVPMVLVPPTPSGPPPGAVATNYCIFALDLTSGGALSGAIIASPVYGFDNMLYAAPGSFVQLMPRDEYAFYLAEHWPRGYNK